jgi:hypothetical protein
MYEEGMMYSYNIFDASRGIWPVTVAERSKA